MNKLLQTMLISAILATSGFASEGLLGEHNQNGNYNLKNDYSIESTGRLNMLSGSMIISSGKTLTNKGIVDISEITDFSGYSGQVQGENGSSIIIPKKSAEVTPGDNALNCDGEYKLTYTAGDADLQVVGNEIQIQTSDNGTYMDASEASTKLGLTFDGTVTMDPQGKDSMSMDDVIAHSENKPENSNKTFDIGQQGLSSTNITLGSDKTIHFGLVGTGAKNINVTGAHKLTISGDSSGMEGKITTEGDLSFGNSGSKGALEVQGELSYAPDTETTVNNAVKVGSLFIPQNSKLTVNGSMTIGYAVLSSVYYGYNYPWVMDWNPSMTTTKDADGNDLETPVKHSDVISSMITSDGTDGWNAGTIHDTVFSYTIDPKGIYVRNCKTKWSDNWYQFEVGTITTATYNNGQTFTLTRTVNNIDLVCYEETTSMHVEGNSTTGIYSTGTASNFARGSSKQAIVDIDAGNITITETTPIGE